MSIPRQYLDEIARRLPKNAVFFSAHDELESEWEGGPIDCLCFDRETIEAGAQQLSGVIGGWVMHVATDGFLVLYGWTPGENSSIPALNQFPGPDGRRWVPELYEGVFMAFRCIGPTTDF